MHKWILYLACFALFLSSCQSIQEYQDTLIETSLVCEIPTLIGNCAGAIAGIPFLIVSIPVAYLENTQAQKSENSTNKNENISRATTQKNESPDTTNNAEPNFSISTNNPEPKISQNSKTQTMLWPIKITSQAGGILCGTPFYPLGATFPREDFDKSQTRQK